MPDLGDTRATLTLDASGFVSGSQQAQAALSAIDESGQRVSKSSATIETHLSSVGAALMAAGASGDGFAQKLQAAAAAADAANARVDGLTIKTQAANAALTDAQSALDGSAERLAALKEALNIDTDNLTQMRAELEQMQASGTASAGAIQMLKDGIAELESDAAALNGQIETATQVDNANAAAVDKASAKYAQLAAQMTQAQLSANKTNTTLTNLTSTLNSSGSGAASIGGMVQSLGSMGSSTLTMASRELSNMAVSATGLSTATVQGRLASAGLSTGLNVLVKSLGAASMGYLALGAAAFAGTYKLMESAVDARNVSKALDTVIKDAANDNYTAALSDVDVTLSDEDGIKTTILEKIKNIIATLTDGETDTIEIVDGLKTDITEENSDLELQIDQYFTDAINAAETPEAKAALQKQWDAVKSSLTDYTQGEIGFIETYAGKSTEICQEAAGELEEIYAQVEALVGGLQTQTELLNGQYGDAYDKVSKGYYASEQDIEYALTFVQANEQNSKAQAMEARNAALNALNDAFRGKDGNEAQTVTYEIDGTKYQVTGTFNELTHSIETQYQTDMRKGGEELNPIQPTLLRTFEKIEELVKNHGKINGIETGYSELDDLLTGFHPGELILVAGRPAMGKTSIGMNFIENAAIRTGKRAAVFSLEMPAEQLATRMLCTEARVDMQHVRRGQLSDDEWAKLCDAMISIGPSFIYVDVTPGITVSQMRSKSRRLQLGHGLDVIMIDYLSLMSATGKTGNRQEEVSQISRSLKSLALELNVPVIALQQLSRAPTGRSNHRPVLSDIRESGAIEQDADVVMFIHREDYYDPDTEEKNIAELIIAKQRNGSLGTVKLGWKGEYTWFMDLSPRAKKARA